MNSPLNEVKINPRVIRAQPVKDISWAWPLSTKDPVAEPQANRRKVCKVPTQEIEDAVERGGSKEA